MGFEVGEATFTSVPGWAASDDAKVVTIQTADLDAGSNPEGEQFLQLSPGGHNVMRVIQGLEPFASYRLTFFGSSSCADAISSEADRREGLGDLCHGS